MNPVPPMISLLFLLSFATAFPTPDDEPIIGSISLYEQDICLKGESVPAIAGSPLQLSVGGGDRNAIGSAAKSLKWIYPGPFNLSFFDGVSESPYAVVEGPAESSYVSFLCAGFKTNGLGGIFLKVHYLDDSRVKTDSPVLLSKESFFTADLATATSPPFRGGIQLIYTKNLV